MTPKLERAVRELEHAQVKAEDAYTEASRLYKKKNIGRGGRGCAGLHKGLCASEGASRIAAC